MDGEQECRFEKFSLSDFLHIMDARYPDLTALEREHQHPIGAVGIVLMAAAMGGITCPGQLAHFTGYSRSFVSAIICNLTNNHLGAIAATTLRAGSPQQEKLMTSNFLTT